MAKNTHAQEAATGTPDSYTDREKSGEALPPRITRAMLGGDHMPDRVEETEEGEFESVGTDYSESSLSESQSNERENPNPQEPALTTENPSDLTAQENFAVNSTDGDGPETETESDEDEEEEEVLPYSEWDYRDLQAECKERNLPANGSTPELIARLEESDKSSTSDGDDDPFV